MAKVAPTVTLNNGIKFPVIGLGTWKSKPGEVEQAVKDAIDAGYRHIDGAYVYANEKEVGQAIRAKIAEGVVKREDIFLTTKLWNTFHGADFVKSAIDLSLKNFGLDYVDLFLIHWPVAYKEGGDLFPRDAAGKIIPSDADYIDTWREMEKLVEQGLTRSIGLSNFNKDQVQRVIDNCKIQPAVNQVECHPYLNQKDLIEYCKSRDIVVTAYSPLGSPDRPWAKPDDVQLLEDPKIKAIAQKYKKSPAQVVLRYLIQRGTVPIPKSVTKSRIQENIKVFDFELTKEDVATIDTFDCNGRICPLSEGIPLKHYPF